MDRAANWSLRIDADRIAWLTCDLPGTSTNVLSSVVMGELDAMLDAIRIQGPAGLIVRSGKANGFVAGADVAEFERIKTAEEACVKVASGQAVLQKLADLPCPSVAIVHGFALGGGLELALACTYRIGADEPGLALGLPEVLLGIHPGFGGTVRSVQTVGVRAALDLMLKGNSYKADRALRAGLLDELVPRQQLDERALQMLRRRPARRSAPLLDQLLRLPLLRSWVAKRTRTALHRTVSRQHYPAPYAIVELWRRTGGAQRPASFAAEARSISELMCTPTSRNLVRVFRLQERLKGLGNASTARFERVHVIGAGVMGGDIAAWAAYRGMRVTLQDRSAELINPALQRAQTFFAKRLKNPVEAAAVMNRLSPDVEGQGVAKADVIIEAIIENVDAKRQLYAQLEPRLKATAILATNTSSLTIETLAAQLHDPGRLIGIHFFNPVTQLPLVEIIAAAGTRSSVLDDGLRFIRGLDKLPLPCKSAPGFIVNRILSPYLNEAFLALQAGTPAPVIDRTATLFGMPMGPIELTDVVGLDVSLHVGRVLAAAFSRPVPPLLEDLVQQNRLGRKSGSGFYEWLDGKVQKQRVDAHAIPPDLQDRLMLPMLNEAVACLRQGLIADADLLDAGAVFATGFAPFRGGPLHYARQRGIDAIVRRMQDLAATYGERFQPDSGWDLLEERL